MRRVFLILAAVCAALLLPGCTAREVLVTKAVSLGLEIENVTGSKVAFSITPGNENASYIFFCVSENHSDFDLPEKEAAQRYLTFLTDSPNQNQTERIQPAMENFSDNCCYRGSRRLKITLLSSNTLYKVLLFQVNPKTRAIIGDVVSETFRTKEVPQKQMNFQMGVERNTLIITPSDHDRTYFWSFDRVTRIYDDYAGIYFFLYSMLDMYEEYGFAEHILSKGTVRYEIPIDQLWEGEDYCVCAIGYEDGEINSEEGSWYFYCRDGIVLPAKF